MSQDGKKVLVRQKGAYKLYDVKPDSKSPKTLSTSGLRVNLVPEQEWEQIFDEVWRRYRDFFYVENMHGYDWPAIRERYRPWLEHVRHRSDLNYVIGEMIAELNVGHAYISGGDYESPERPRVALMGADLELDAASGRYRISRILGGHNEEPEYRAPLTEIGVDAREGDYILAIDGEDLLAGENPYRLLRHKASRPVELLLNDKPEPDGARTVVFQPIRDESKLRYLNWVEGNLKAVAEATDGKVGYIHVPDMSSSGISEFIKWYFPQLRKEGLVVDVRGNGGGNVSPNADRAAQPQAARHPVLAHQCGFPDLPQRSLPRTLGVPGQRELCVRRRHLRSPVQGCWPGPADREAFVGRRDRHHLARSPDGRWRRPRAGVRDECY